MESCLYSLQKTGFSGPDTSALQTAGYIGVYNGRFYGVAFGSNGIAMDLQGRIIWRAQGDRSIVRLEKDGKTRTVLADKYQGKRLNRPNDLVVKSDGWIYFTDPHSNNPGAANEWPGSVYRLKDAGAPELLANNIQPNGLVFCPMKISVRRGRKDLALRRETGRHNCKWQRVQLDRL